jgi:hypothetical protein
MLISEALHSPLDMVESIGRVLCTTKKMLPASMNYKEGSWDAKNDKHKGSYL